MALKLVKQNKAFGGWVKQFKHASSATKTEMTFSVFLPQEAETSKVPYVMYLSGLTCTDENVTTKGNSQKWAAKHGIAFVAPDTSPRGAGIEGEDESYDFGTGAGFYVDATTSKFSTNYNMYSYISKELPGLLESELPLDGGRKSITGHSMGGHGALIMALKNPGMFRSASAFAPIAHPSACPWGEKAFTGYLGEDKTAWAAYDATELAKSYDGPVLPILCDQGTADEFYEKKQLLPEDFAAVAKDRENLHLESRMADGYDHSYYFIATFMEDHLDFAANYLKK
ncbi:S-formylglutathione hydrolase (FGH) (Esterase D) [Durusdinium trenchii]|uniref:S-formylglutathione hydrolase n=1 Tax=Durusdinium trenchii TaxID=1381693 RepID=A0ABP0QRR9_9DINO